MVPSLIFPGRDSSAYCRTMMAILNAKGKKTHTHRTVSSTQDWLTDQPTTWLEPLLAGILIKETFEPPYIAGNSAVLQTRASLPMLWIFNLFSLISCTLLFLVTVYDGCVWKKMYLWENNYSLLIWKKESHLSSAYPIYQHSLNWPNIQICQSTVINIVKLFCYFASVRWFFILRILVWFLR